VIIPITDHQIEFANQAKASLEALGMRVKVDDDSSRMQAKIRNAQMEKIPYMLVVGKREVEQNAVAVRLRSGEDLGAMPLSEFAELAKGVIATRSLDLK
jgi:threonyl-tRNA synthetase